MCVESVGNWELGVFGELHSRSLALCVVIVTCLVLLVLCQPGLLVCASPLAARRNVVDDALHEPRITRSTTGHHLSYRRLYSESNASWVVSALSPHTAVCRDCARG